MISASRRASHTGGHPPALGTGEPVDHSRGWSSTIGGDPPDGDLRGSNASPGMQAGIGVGDQGSRAVTGVRRGLLRLDLTVGMNEVSMGTDRGLTPAEVQLVSRFSGRVSGPIGRFTGRREPDRWIWDDVAGALLARPVHDRSTGLEVLLDQVPAAEQGLLTDAIAAAVPDTPFTVSCQLRSATGECRSVLILMEALEEAPAQFVAIRASVMEDLMAGAGWWIVGYLIDVTQLRLRAARQAGAHAVERAVEHRAVIEQAKGMLMLTERLDADAAFAVLAQRSQAANTKLHLVAAELVAEFAAHGCAADARERLSACGGEWPLNRD